MKVIKWILVAFIALLLSASASTFFMSEDFRVYQTQVIRASPDAVFKQINTLQNWKNWSYWMDQDEEMDITFNDIPSGVGASYSWKSHKKEQGNGSLSITVSNENQYVQCTLSFDGYGDSRSEYILKPVEGGTELTSAMDSPTKGVIDKLMARVMIRPMMTKAFMASAHKMEAYLLANPDAAKPSKLIDSVSAKAGALQDCTLVIKK